MDKRVSWIRYRVCKQIVCIPLFAILLISTASKPIIHSQCDGTAIDVKNCCDTVFDSSDLCVIDTVCVWNKSIRIEIPATITNTGKKSQLLPYWIVDVVGYSRNEVGIRFSNTVNSDMCEIRVIKRAKRLYIRDELWWYRDSYNSYNPLTANVMAHSAIKILYKEINEPLDDIIIFSNHFREDMGDNAIDVFFCPLNCKIQFNKIIKEFRGRRIISDCTFDD